MADLKKVFSAEAWHGLLSRQLELRRRRKAEDILDTRWREVGPVSIEHGAETFVADGLWHNPNYFLRLRLYIAAYARTGKFNLLGILQSRADVRQRRAMERIGFREFVYLDDEFSPRAAEFEAAARRLLAPCTSHADMLRIQLSENVPAYIWYDTVLHNKRHAQPPLDDPEWAAALARMLGYIAAYQRILAERVVGRVALSHGWKSEFASLIWLALRRDVEVALVTAVSEAIRIRRLRKLEDFRLPVENLSYAVYERLDDHTKGILAAYGEAELHRRQTQATTDINIKFAYKPGKSVIDREAARALMGADGRPLAVIYGHSWFDYPHLYGMRNFDDFLDCLKATVEKIRELTHVQWLLRPHPMEQWYGGYRMREAVANLPPHIRLMPDNIDTLTVMSGADAIVTVHGTVGIEAPAAGLPVVAADNSYYAGWGFAHVAISREHYFELLANIHTLPRPDAEARRRMLACFACAYGEPLPAFQALRVPCDSRGSLLFNEVHEIVQENRRGLDIEVGRIAEFLAQDEIDSFTAHAFVSAARRASGQVAAE